jgi:hypothetical protein
LEQRVAQHIGRTDALTETITAERTARENEVRTAVANVKEWAEGRPESKLLQRLEALEQRFSQHVGQSFGRSDALAEAIAAERAARENETKAIVDDVKTVVGSEFQAELVALAERLKAMPGKLPMAEIWCAESITYEGQFVSHDGALWQARARTKRARPFEAVDGHGDWIWKGGSRGNDAKAEGRRRRGPPSAPS